MEVIIFYGIFAVATGLTFLYEIVYPVLTELYKIDPKNVLIEYKLLSYLTFFLFSLIVAPLVLPATLIPTWGIRFRSSLLLSLQ